ncbi:MAG: nucleoside triphosphate pyrophosphohydrolase [Bacteroidota bacterium]|nr:nucleoside triphosphate pyrophosphohydrolase [Bacteroidota bacterium]
MKHVKKLDSLDKLLEVVYELRQECPWDKEQTWESLRNLSIEELYELVDAIDQNDADELETEAGDVLLHILFYAMIAEEKGLFDMATLMDKLRKKLIVRHPHIYGDIKLSDSTDVLKNWEKIKLKSGKKTLLSGVPQSLPAMVKAFRIQQKVSTVGFDWVDVKDVLDKVKEEITEFEEAKAKQNHFEIESEFGDILFSLINYARFNNIDPEQALAKTNAKFINRFNGMEQLIIAENKEWSELSLPDLNTYWEKIKQQENV